jgi:acyl carrier protein
VTASERQVRDLLAAIVGPDVAEAVAADEFLFEQGIVDSLHLVQLVEALESTCGIVVEGDELRPENFGSVDAMAAYIERKQQP